MLLSRQKQTRVMKSSGSSLASRLLLLRRRGQEGKGVEEESDNGRTVAKAATSSPLQQTSTSSAAPLVEVEPLHALSSAALHTTSLAAAARALRGGTGAGAFPRDNTPAEELLAVASMALVFGFVFFGPWLTLAALVDVLAAAASAARGGGGGGRGTNGVSGGGGSASGSGSSSSSSFNFSLAFLAVVAVLTFVPVYPCGAWPLFRDARVWDCWRRYFRLRIVSPPLPFLEVEGEEEKKTSGTNNGKASPSRPSSSSSSSLLSPPSPQRTNKTLRKAYIFAHYPHGCFPGKKRESDCFLFLFFFFFVSLSLSLSLLSLSLSLSLSHSLSLSLSLSLPFHSPSLSLSLPPSPVGSFLTAVGLIGCRGTGLPAGTRPAVASALFRLPVLRQIYTWCDCVPCDSRTLSGLLRSGNSVGLPLFLFFSF